MKTEIVMNGHITVLLIPENDAEKEVLKCLYKQSNEIIEFRSTMTVLNKNLSNGLIITKKESGLADTVIPKVEVHDEDK